MKILLQKKQLIMIFLIIFAITGCAQKNDYNQFSKEFIQQYNEATKYIDVSNVEKSLQSINSSDNKKRIDSMGMLIENIKDNIPKNEQEQYDEYQKWYTGLVYLSNLNIDWEKTDLEQRRNIYKELTFIKIRRRNNL